MTVASAFALGMLAGAATLVAVVVVVVVACIASDDSMDNIINGEKRP